MAKLKTSFFCQSCGTNYSKWLGQCTSCKQWNTIVEESSERFSKSTFFKEKTSYNQPHLVSSQPNICCFFNFSLRSLIVSSSTNSKLESLEYISFIPQHRPIRQTGTLFLLIVTNYRLMLLSK
jgi:predicted ATP-dependent serine protease